MTTPDKPQCRTRRLRRPVRHHFDNGDKARLTDRLVAASKAARSLETEKKASAAEFSSRSKMIELEIDATSEKLERGWETRTADCIAFLDWPEPGKKTITRADRPDEVVAVELMTDDDRQLPLEDGKEEDEEEDDGDSEPA